MPLAGWATVRRIVTNHPALEYLPDWQKMASNLAPSPTGAKSAEPEALVKILLLGDSGVGKSSMLLRFSEDEFDETYINTIGIDFKTRSVEIEGKKIKLQIWDTAGQERFQSLQALYYRGAQGIVLVYDLTKGKSFSDIRQWISAVDKHANSVAVRMLVGNKADLGSQREVSFEEGKRLADEFGLLFGEASAKVGAGVSDAFMQVATTIAKRGLADAPAPSVRPRTVVDSQAQKGCCN